MKSSRSANSTRPSIGYVPPTLTPEQLQMHTWRPDDRTWATIKQHSVESPATVVISGYVSQHDRTPVSTMRATISTSRDPVGAPIFYRDVPLIPPAPETEQRGVIKPLPDSVLPKIKWQLRYINRAAKQGHDDQSPHLRQLPLLLARRQNPRDRRRRPRQRQGTLRPRPPQESQHHHQRLSPSLEFLL